MELTHRITRLPGPDIRVELDQDGIDWEFDR